MRQIKFRVWEPQRQIMLYPKAIQFALGGIDRVYGDEYGFSIDSEPDMVVMKFTGLKDRNGKDVFEGDILKRDKDDNPWEVYYQPTMACFMASNFCTNSMLIGESFVQALNEHGRIDAGIIGNIHEHPSLLKSLN